MGTQHSPTEARFINTAISQAMSDAGVALFQLSREVRWEGQLKPPVFRELEIVDCRSFLVCSEILRPSKYNLCLKPST